MVPFVGQAEIDQRGAAVTAHQDVQWFDVAMEDLARMGMFEGFGDFGDEAGVRTVGVVEERLHPGSDAPLLIADVAACRISAREQPLDEFHDEVVDPVLFTDRMDRKDVGVAQAGRGEGLAAESLDGLGIATEVEVEDLEGDGAVQRAGRAPRRRAPSRPGRSAGRVRSHRGRAVESLPVTLYLERCRARPSRGPFTQRPGCTPRSRGTEFQGRCAPRLAFSS